MEMNRKYSEKWPVITQQKEALPTAEEYKTIPDKMKFFSESPGEGD